MFDVTISDIPPEFIFQIGQLLAPSDLNALVQANRCFYQDLDSSLWRQNADLALLWAAENGDLKSARKALKFGANINTEHPPPEEEWYQPWGILHNEHDKSGATPLFLAAAAGHVEMVKLFVGIDAININRRGSPCRRKPLTIAIIAQKEDVVRVLLANPNINADGFGGPMLDASFVGNVNIIKQLIDHGIQPTRFASFLCSSPCIPAHRSRADIAASRGKSTSASGTGPMEILRDLERPPILKPWTRARR